MNWFHVHKLTVWYKTAAFLAEKSEEWAKIRDEMLASMNDPEVKNYQVRNVKSEVSDK